MRIKRYCPACKHTTRHDYNEAKSTFKCLSRTHEKNAKRAKEMKK